MQQIESHRGIHNFNKLKNKSEICPKKLHIETLPEMKPHAALPGAGSFTAEVS